MVRGNDGEKSRMYVHHANPRRLSGKPNTGV